MSTEQKEKELSDAEMFDKLLLAVAPSVVEAQSRVYKNIFSRDIASTTYNIVTELMKYRKQAQR